MGGQKASAPEIHEADAAAVLARKAHHEVLHEEIRTFLDDACDHPENLPAASRHETVEKDHGRRKITAGSKRAATSAPTSATGWPTAPNGAPCAAWPSWKPGVRSAP